MSDWLSPRGLRGLGEIRLGGITLSLLLGFSSLFLPPSTNKQSKEMRPQQNRGFSTNIDNFHYQGQNYNEDAYENDGDFAELDVDPSIPHMQNKKITWSINEDTALISAYINTTINPQIGTSQRSPTKWKDILSQYRSARKDNANINIRNVDQVRARWRRIAAAVSKWVEFLAEAQKEKGGGINDQDVIRNALTIWEHSNKGHKFQFMEHWKLLKDYPKWESIIGCVVPTSNLPCDDSSTPETPNTVSSGKRSRANDDFDNLLSPAGENVQINLENTATSPVKRLMDVKMDKSTGKQKISQQSSLQNPQIERMSIAYGENIEVEREKIALERERLEEARIARQEKMKSERIARKEKLKNDIIAREEKKYDQKFQAWLTFANRGEENLSDVEKKMWKKLSEFLGME